METTICNCLACKFCLPPAKHINGRMCNYEEIKNIITECTMAQIRKIRPGWKSGSDQHRISAAIDNKLWNWLREKPNKNRTINQALYAIKEIEQVQLEQDMINLFGELKRELK